LGREKLDDPSFIRHGGQEPFCGKGSSIEESYRGVRQSIGGVLGDVRPERYRGYSEVKRGNSLVRGGSTKVWVWGQEGKWPKGPDRGFQGLSVWPNSKRVRSYRGGNRLTIFKDYTGRVRSFGILGGSKVTKRAGYYYFYYGERNQTSTHKCIIQAVPYERGSRIKKTVPLRGGGIQILIRSMPSTNKKTQQCGSCRARS